MELNRGLQREILMKLAHAYPGDTTQAWNEIAALGEESDVFGNLLYLEAHGLLVSGADQYLDGSRWVNTSQLKITHLGLDFLADDGGLSAVLGVVTIRLHSDTIKDLIEAKIAQSDLAPADKKRWIDQLRSLPADATKHLVQKLVEKGLDSGPAAVAAVGAFLQSQGLW
ncbi:hypothetical protein [Achromobacter insolitus]|uniref:hypothetical protein n=1 Tax=Achromobacter insolitus TaxID=217204 RepID=UPI0013E2FA26|nr:hypothetical protein [Achromobacter insolitus]NGT16948.1 hypothetical protein [Achromobacter insolitus]